MANAARTTKPLFRPSSAFENRNPLSYHHLGLARGLDTGYKVTPRMASALCWSGVDLSAR